jgi:hypothetical protein
MQHLIVVFKFSNSHLQASLAVRTCAKFLLGRSIILQATAVIGPVSPEACQLPECGTRGGISTGRLEYME